MEPTSVTAESAMQGQLLDLFLYMGSEWVLHLLVLLSIISVAITLERLVHFAWRRDDLEGLEADLSTHLADGDMTALHARLDRSRSPVARIVRRGLDGLKLGAAAVEELVAGATQKERLRMERGLAFLGTLGNNAPFIGLFGTVLGIIRAFQDLSSNTMEGSSAVMAGIAEALIATAIGLLVALPAVAIFNGFSRTIRARLASSDAVVRVLMAHAKAEEV